MCQESSSPTRRSFLSTSAAGAATNVATQLAAIGSADAQSSKTKRGDLPKITLFLHGDDDQIVPIGAAAMLASKIVKGAKLKIYKGAPHGMCTTLKDQVNEDLLAIIRS